MSREADFAQFEKFIKSWQEINDDFETFLRQFLLEMAQRAISKIKPNTPVDTGALREMWAVGEINLSGENFEVEIINQQEYASFVEYGHRRVNGVWQKGRFMMTVGINEVQQQLPARFDKALRAYLQSKGAV